MLQVILIFSDLILIKQIIASSTLFLQLGVIDSWKHCCLGERVISHCLECNDKNLGKSCEWGGMEEGMIKNAYTQCISKEFEHHKFENSSHAWENV